MSEDNLHSQLESLFSGLSFESEPGPAAHDLLDDFPGDMQVEQEQEGGTAESLQAGGETTLEPERGQSQPVEDVWAMSQMDGSTDDDDPSSITPYLAISDSVPQMVAPIQIGQVYMSYDQSFTQYRLQPDQVIDGRYKVLEPLGSGGFAEVYKCLDVHLEQKFAVKLISLPTSAEDVLREARIAARLQHPNILRVVNIGRLNDTGIWYIVMDYKQGSQTLEAVLDQAESNLRRLPLDERTLQIVSEVAEALDHAHSLGIVHQDVKPTNIMIDQEGHAYLTDFGLAMTKRPVGTAASMKTVGAQNGMSGTIPYMAPEEFEDQDGEKQANPSTDIYSLAVVTYEMLVGQLPYPGKAAGPIIRQIVEGVRTPPRQLNAELPREVESILLRSLSLNIHERCHTATEFAAVLQDAAQAYITDEELYEEARQLFSNRQWRESLARFEQLESLAPSYKETRLFMERARKQAQLLDLYDEARALLDAGDYESCMDKLDVLVRLDPAFEVTNMRERARLALVERLYHQALDLYQARDYRSCGEVLPEIVESDPGFRDKDNIEEQARRLLDQQRHLQSLYDTSVVQTQKGDWVAAQRALEELYREAPNYGDVEARLTMVRYIARLSRMHQAAHECFKSGDYLECIERLDELIQVNNEYKANQIASLRDQAAMALYDRGERLLEQERYQEAAADLDAFEMRTGRGDSRQVRARIRKGIAARELRAKLDSLYRQAAEYLDARKYGRALEVMREIRRLDPSFVDAHYVERRARDSLCSLLYAEALGALVRKQYQDAWDIWTRLREVDPGYPDPQNLEEQIARRLNRWDWLTFWRRP